MSDSGRQGALRLRGEVVLTADEVRALQRALGADLLTSATLRRWIEDGEDLPPHSVSVALETHLRMLNGSLPETGALLNDVINRMAELFPDDVLPLYTN